MRRSSRAWILPFVLMVAAGTVALFNAAGCGLSRLRPRGRGRRRRVRQRSPVRRSQPVHARSMLADRRVHARQREERREPRARAGELPPPRRAKDGVLVSKIDVTDLRSTPSLARPTPATRWASRRTSRSRTTPSARATAPPAAVITGSASSLHVDRRLSERQRLRSFDLRRLDGDLRLQSAPRRPEPGPEFQRAARRLQRELVRPRQGDADRRTTPTSRRRRPCAPRSAARAG